MSADFALYGTYPGDSHVIELKGWGVNVQLWAIGDLLPFNMIFHVFKIHWLSYTVGRIN